METKLHRNLKKVAQLWRLKGIKSVKTTLNPSINSKYNKQIVRFVLVSRVGFEHRAVKTAIMLAPLEKKGHRHTNTELRERRETFDSQPT